MCVCVHPKDTGLLLALVHQIPDLGRVARARGSEGVGFFLSPKIVSLSLRILGGGIERGHYGDDAIVYSSSFGEGQTTLVVYMCKKV
jgi:hypothetical protein